ncbi:MAG: FAD-binding oxidoreductase [Acidimicrobiia bacterium]
MLTDPEVTASYETDWTRRWRGRARCVVRPGSTEEVAAVISLCQETGTAIVPQGGNTGLVGGSVPRNDEVVLSLRRMSALGAVDVDAAQVTAGAGATLEALQDHVRPHGFDFGVDLAARGSATLGGMAATNAGGIHFVRHGPMRAQVVGVEAVLGTGAVISRLAGLEKDNTGFDLASLLCGSEGTLGVITALRLRLVPTPAEVTTALLGLASTTEAIALLRSVRRLPTLLAVEWFHADGAALVREKTGATTPFAANTYLVVETTSSGEDLAELIGDAQAAVATDPDRRAELWAVRERHTEAINALGVPHKLDVTVPLADLATFEADVRRVIANRWPDATTVLFGHLADGNVHVNVVGPAPDDEAVDDAVLRLVASYGGSISAEHGIGVAKLPWLSLSRSPAEIAAMRAIKVALDPAGILNPGVLLA